MLRTTSITVGTTATLLVDAKNGSPQVPKKVTIQVPTGGQTVFVGGVTRTGSDGLGGASYTLSTANGLGLASPSTTTFELFQDDDLYGIVAGTTQAVIVLENLTN